MIYEDGVGSQQVQRRAAKELDRLSISAQSTLSRATPVDVASLSTTAGQVAKALLGSDVRTERIEPLRQAIANGTYHVSSSDVAGNLLIALLR